MQPGIVIMITRWSRTPPKERALIMNKIADIVESRIDEFALAESRDQGKPVWLARAVDIPRVCHNFRFFASGSLHIIDTYVFIDPLQLTLIHFG